MSEQKTSEQKAKRLFELALDKKPKDPLVLDARGISPLWDFYIFLSVGSDRQAEAISSELRRTGKTEKLGLHHIEHGKEGGWMLMDFNDVVVHIFTEEQREFYKLEKFLKDAPAIDFGFVIDEM